MDKTKATRIGRIRREGSLRMFSTFVKFGKLLLILLISLIVLTPFYWLIVTSLRRTEDMMAPHPSLFPLDITLEHYNKVLHNVNILRYLLNSSIMAGTTTLLALFIATLAVFALTRYFIKGGTIATMGLFGTQMLPPVVVVISLFTIWVKLGIYDTLFSLILSNLAFRLPVLIWILLPAFETVPQDLENAATIDGCGGWGLLFRIFIPICSPTLAAGAIYAFIFTWNEYLFALCFTESISARVLTLGIKEYFGQHFTDWGGLMATSAILTIPILLLFFYLQKYLVKGLLAGSMKG